MSSTFNNKRKYSEQNKSLKKSVVESKTNGEDSMKSTEGSSERDELKLVKDLDYDAQRITVLRKSARKLSPNKKYQQDFNMNSNLRHSRRHETTAELSDGDDKQSKNELVAPTLAKPSEHDLHILQEDNDIAGKSMFGFNTPKKRNGMKLVAMNTPKTPKINTKRSKSVPAEQPKTPSHIRHRVKNEIAKLVETNSDSDFSGDDSAYEPFESDDSSLSSNDDDDAADDEPKTPYKGRRPIVVPVLPKTPSEARLRQTVRTKLSGEYVPESDGYFQSHSTHKIHTSDRTLDRLKNPRLPADCLFSLLAQMKLSAEHESSINAFMEEYRSYFPKWMYILNEGYNLLLYGLGSKRQLLQYFHREVLAQQTVLVVNGFFPSLTLKDILDSIIGEILDAGISASNPHEAVDIIEEEFALIPETHLYLIVHNLDGTMLRNAKAQAILSRLSAVRNIHLLASIDHINTPLLWDHTKLSNFNFSWWDCTTMLPYTDETAFENSLLVQNSGALALSSLRSVFSSLTTNSRGIYMLIVKFQLKNKSNPNYQGMPFKELYWSCREAFLVSSDLALRAQLTEFLDHKLVKSKRIADGSEQLNIPIDATLLQQFLDEQERK